MEKEIFLWYNGVLCEYNFGSAKEFQDLEELYSTDKLEVLYTMEHNQSKLCKKIMDSLNAARFEVA